jgi:hypothetical protein
MRTAGARRIAAVARSPVAALCLGAYLVAGCTSSGSHPVASDVTISGCRTDPNDHRAIVTGTIHNHSSKRSNYVVQATIAANDSKIETGFASVLKVGPDDRTDFTIHGVGAGVPSGTTLHCTVAHVERVVD